MQMVMMIVIPSMMMPFFDYRIMGWDDDDDDYNNEYRLQLFWPQFCVLASLASGRGEPH